jgi:signal transduction histidine kinase
MRLLIIDDDPIDRQTYRRYLTSDDINGYVVVEAGTAEEGVRLLAEGPYDCLVLDYCLPGADGIEVLRSLLDSQGGALAAPVVMMTGQGSEAVAVEAMKLGITDYLTKDRMTELAFRRSIRNAVERFRLRSALREKTQHLEKANLAMKKHGEEMQRFYHTVSHELKTPLSAVREFVALVLDGVAGPLQTPDQSRFLGLALAGCDQVARQVNDLLDSARADVDKLQLRVTAIRVDQAISLAVASIQKQADGKHLELEVAIAQELPMVLADEARLTQILGNLLSNAAKFTPPGGHIRISANARAGSSEHIEIAVSDSGCGIAPADLERIFDRLFQAPNAEELSAGGGLGLGLTIARDLVQRHGGKLTVESRVGAGSRFRVTLPALPPQALEAGQRASAC